MESKVSIVWFRNDLRLHDNEAFHEASFMSDTVIPVYVFDPRVFGVKTSFGFEKTGAFRAKFILESVYDLRERLREKGSDLIIQVGYPEETLPKLGRENQAHYIFCNRERTHEEVQVQDTLEQTLWTYGMEVRYSRGKMLYYTADLPFPVTHTPDVFTAFRKEVEKFISVRKPLSTEKFVYGNLDFIKEKGEIPALEDFGLKEKEVGKGIVLKGGETEALKQLDYYFDDKRLPSSYKKTRNQLLGRDFSTKFSSWLSVGCLSPKMIYQRLKAYEEMHGANESTYWIFFELLWRDFFRLQGKKHGNRIFQPNGISETKQEMGSKDMELFSKWAEAKTGVPFIDANMLELNDSGFMSNRGRQNVASYLIHDMGLNWVIGAEYFESLLIDYDPCSNYCNWNYIAGVGCDPREKRVFNILSQAKKYDPKGEFVKYWIPALKNLPDSVIHNPNSSLA